MMQVSITVEGSTYADLEFKKNQAIQSFLTGAPEGTTSAIDDVGVALKTGDVPAGWDANLGKVITLPLFQITTRWNVYGPGEQPTQ